MRKGRFIWLARGDGKLIRVWLVEIRKVTGNCDEEFKCVFEQRSYDGSVIVYEDDDEFEEFKIVLVIMRYMKPLTLFQDLCKTNAVERGRLFGFDVGDKYVGLAVSDPQNKNAIPLSVLKFNIELMASLNVDLLLKPLTLHLVELKTMLDKFAAVGILQKIALAWMVDKESRTMHC